uniref:Probable chromosome-partitioning protein ParB n=1 Tax=Candidatus Kentrum sp. MB TaxID=2138164 RepID=A0A450XEN0_9GAMM|nr:MAG: chromosome partitioning protein, ParB family [Candidatus Kentron sp. MB]VFK27731.1 MAG: chromosome partitioning protein, ParB family [Candidatus Kentron sp. MB]VFK74409.1 MAG: chromosome partitioning protein, ParB family [Candidatus Kentron sp. MB]
MKRKGLGRGLDALLGTQMPAIDLVKRGELRNLPVEQIRQSRYQPRVAMDSAALEDLANSIRVQGVVQPIVVRPVDNGEIHFEIIAGERRWRAAQLAGLDEIPAVVRSVPDEAVVVIALIENVQREALNPIEEAIALRRLIDEFNMTHEMAAKAVGKSRTAITNLLRLLDLNADVRDSLEKGHLDMGHARALLGLEGSLQSQAAQQVLAKGLSARETERLVRRLKTEAGKEESPHRQRDPNVRQLEVDLSERLGTVVQVRHGVAGKGFLVIRYASLDQLDGIIARVY